jgi:glycine/D-amino acid oxidase-like deaminating enzyme
MAMTATQYPTLVIGAGVVGLSTALYLQRAGVQVAVIDPLGLAGARHSAMPCPPGRGWVAGYDRGSGYCKYSV